MQVIHKCRVAILDLQDTDAETDSMDPEDLFFWDLFSCWDESEDGLTGVAVYEYDAPEGFERYVGYGILFLKDWSAPDTCTKFQIRINDAWQNLT